MVSGRRSPRRLFCSGWDRSWRRIKAEEWMDPEGKSDRQARKYAKKRYSTVVVCVLAVVWLTRRVVRWVVSEKILARQTRKASKLFPAFESWGRGGGWTLSLWWSRPPVLLILAGIVVVVLATVTCCDNTNTNCTNCEEDTADGLSNHTRELLKQSDRVNNWY